MTDKEFFILLGVVLAVMQLVYRILDKRDNSLILKAFSEALKSFDPHVARTEKTYTLIKKLSEMHNAKDSDGRPLWYVPKELIDNERELVKISGIIASTQERLIHLFEKMDIKIDDHKSTCTSQFATLDKKVGAYGFANGQGN